MIREGHAVKSLIRSLVCLVPPDGECFELGNQALENSLGFNKKCFCCLPHSGQMTHVINSQIWEKCVNFKHTIFRLILEVL